MPSPTRDLGQRSVSHLSESKFKPGKQRGSLMQGVGDQVMKHEEPNWGCRGSRHSRGAVVQGPPLGIAQVELWNCGGHLAGNTTHSREGKEKHPGYSLPPTVPSSASAFRWRNPAGSHLVQKPRKGKRVRAWLGLGAKVPTTAACSSYPSFFTCETGMLPWPVPRRGWEDEAIVHTTSR